MILSPILLAVSPSYVSSGNGSRTSVHVQASIGKRIGQERNIVLGHYKAAILEVKSTQIWAVFNSAAQCIVPRVAGGFHWACPAITAPLHATLPCYSAEVCIAPYCPKGFTDTQEHWFCWQSPRAKGFKSRGPSTTLPCCALALYTLAAKLLPRSFIPCTSVSSSGKWS
jgi:hypothetical protein